MGGTKSASKIAISSALVCPRPYESAPALKPAREPRRT